MSGKIKTTGKSLSRSFSATGSDGITYLVNEFIIHQEIQEHNGNWMPISNGPREFQLSDGRKIYGSAKDDNLFEIANTTITLTPKDPI